MQGIPEQQKELVTIIHDRFEAIKKALLNIDDYDALVILGKGDEDYQDIQG